MGSTLRVIAFWLGLLGFIGSAFPNDGRDPWTRGTEAVRLGQFEAAVAAWTSAAGQARAAGTPVEESDALVRRAEALGQLGRNGEALADLERAGTLARNGEAPERLAAIDLMIGNAYRALGAADRALPRLTESLAVDTTGSGTAGSETTIAALNGMGNLLFDRESYERSLGVYRQAWDQARRLNDPALDATLGINTARALVMLGRLPEADAMLAQEATVLGRAASDHRKAFLLVAHATVLMTIQEARAQSDPTRIGRIEQSLRQAIDLSDRLGDRRTQSHAAGRLGLLYEHRGRLEEAKALTT
jgi:tetratricopeptide (TPR) repeat protein